MELKKYTANNEKWFIICLKREQKCKSGAVKTSLHGRGRKKSSCSISKK